ncbi:MAG: response regulator [Deltaproteobacteria bacterium]|nr:response regulator [Deltaproteobacteria bacterium]
MERKILVVDDEISIRQLMYDALSDQGYKVYLAENANDAIGIQNREKTEVIFLDLKLFGMNGIDLCRQIRRFHPVPVIYAMTGWAGLFEIEECREAGFDDYFQKPLQLDTLFNSVDGAFEKIDRWYNRARRP